MWLLSTFQQLFLLLVLALTYAVGGGAQVDSCCNTEQCHPDSAALAAVPNTARLPMSTAHKVNSMSFIQTIQTMQKTQKEIDEDEETEKEAELEPIVAKVGGKKAEEGLETLEEMGEEEGRQQKLEDGSWKARASQASFSNQGYDSGGPASRDLQLHVDTTQLIFPPPGMQPVLGTAAIKLNHSAGNRNATAFVPLSSTKSMQNMSHGSAFDVNRTTAIVPISSNKNAHNMWMRLRQRGSTLSWVLPAALVFVVVLVVIVCFGGHMFSDSQALRQQLGAMGHISSRIRSGGGAHGTTQATSPYGPLQFSPEPSAAWREQLPPPLQFSPRPSATQPEQRPVLAANPLVSPPRSTSLEAVGFLCKLLVVPPGCESILYMPMNPSNSFHVLDQHGDPVIGVSLLLQGRRRAEFSTWEGAVIAQCVAMVPDSSDEFQLLCHSGEPFATLTPGAPDEVLKAQSHENLIEGKLSAWTVRTPSGSEWYFRGHFESYSGEVSDPQRRVLAMWQPKEPTGRTHDGDDVYLLRVAPLMDVSIILCSLAAVYLLKSL